MNSDSPEWVQSVTTPAFVFDERRMLEIVDVMDDLRRETDIRVLCAVKAMTNGDVIRRLAPLVDGFTVASLFDSMLVREITGSTGFISIGTPGFNESNIDQIGDLCNNVVLNSLSQWERYRTRLQGGQARRTSIGLRINPGFSNVADRRYDPSRLHTKLGVHVADLEDALVEKPNLLDGLEGILFHTNCDAKNFSPIFATVEMLAERLDTVLKNIRWINLGGGYLFTDKSDLSPLKEAARLLHTRYGLDVFIEPGAAFVRESGYLVAEVTDLIPTTGPMVAVLDTTVNHAPEVFEYQYVPDVLGSEDGGRYNYILAGSTCLAGDLFGEYSFPTPLELGSRIVFPNMGAYTTVKAHTFNGINLPSLYQITQDGEIHLRRTFNYDDYRSRIDPGRH